MADGDAAQRKGAVVNILRPPPLWTESQAYIAVRPDDPCVSVSLVTKNENKNENLFENGSWKHNFDVLEIFLTHRQGFLGETSIF